MAGRGLVINGWWWFVVAIIVVHPHRHQHCFANSGLTCGVHQKHVARAHVPIRGGACTPHAPHDEKKRNKHDDAQEDTTQCGGEQPQSYGEEPDSCLLLLLKLLQEHHVSVTTCSHCRAATTCVGAI